MKQEFSFSYLPRDRYSRYEWEDPLKFR